MIIGTLYLRPHHLLCMLLFDPTGHSKPYIEIMNTLIAHLNNTPAQKIVLINELDITCDCCPHNDSGKCLKQDKVTEIIESILKLCGLSVGDSMTWEELRKIVIDKIIMSGNIDNSCESCSYLEQCRVKAKEYIT